MASTWSDVWRRVRLHAPDVPFGLVQDWTLTAYRVLLDRRPWVFAQVWVDLTTVVGTATVTLPADFGAFLLVLDRTAQRQLAFWYTQADLFGWDPAGTETGPPRALIPQGLSAVTLTLNRPVYRWYPIPSVVRTFPALYRIRPVAPADRDPLRGVLADRPDVLEVGALAQCARWPGTTDRKNPYFNLQTASALQQDFLRLCHQLELRDDDQAQQSWQARPEAGWAAWDLGSTAHLRASDATVGDYW